MLADIAKRYLDTDLCFADKEACLEIIICLCFTLLEQLLIGRASRDIAFSKAII